MPHKLSDHVLDNGLDALRAATALHVLSRDPLTYADVATYSVGNKSLLLSSNLSISRSTGGYAKTSDGRLTWFPANTLRITDLGLLVEDLKENKVTNSQTFQNWGFWAGTTDDAVAPDGTQTADLITASYIRSSNISISINTPYMMFCYLKPKTGTSCRLSISDGTAVDWAADFTLSGAGSYAVATEVGGGDVLSMKIEALADGWYYCEMVGQTSNPMAGGIGQARINNLGNQNWAWGAQVEQSSSFESSYIPTTTAAATRAADVVTCAGELNTILSSLPHSVMLDLIGFAGQYGFSGGYVSILGSANNYNALLRTGATASIVSMTSPDNLQVTFGHSKTFIAGVKIASAQDGSGRSLVGGGGSVASDIEHLAIANVYFGRGDGDWNRFSGYFRRLTVWNKRLLNARLQTLTDPDDPAVYPALDAVVDLDFEHGCYFFSDLEDAADGSGRQIKTAACTGSASATATATDWALVDSVNQRLLANGKLDEPVDKVSGQAFEMPSLILQLPSH